MIQYLVQVVVPGRCSRVKCLLLLGTETLSAWREMYLHTRL